MLIETIDSLRQWLRYPQEFRIGASKYLELTESLEALTDLLKHTSTNSLTISETEDWMELYVVMENRFETRKNSYF